MSACTKVKNDTWNKVKHEKNIKHVKKHKNVESKHVNNVKKT